jgi:hypothetical protein
MTGDASDEEAAWQDLVAHYANPVVAEGKPVPWPTREDLSATTGSGSAAPDIDASGPDTADLDARELDGPGVDGAAFGPGLDTRAGDSTDDEPEAADPRLAPSADPVPGVIPAPPQVRIVRPASPAAATGDDDDHFVPPAPPPLPRLDPLTKGAWAALFGGPGYLLVAVMANWQVPGWAAFCAVAAFIGGFATLVVHMGDRPPRDSGHDDGAVV